MKMKTIIARVTPAERAALDAICVRDRITMSALLRAMVVDALHEEQHRTSTLYQRCVHV